MDKNYKLKENALEIILESLQLAKRYKRMFEQDVYTKMNHPYKIKEYEHVIICLENLIEEVK